MLDQLFLWENNQANRPVLGSTFQKVAEGSNPCMFLGKIECNYQSNMNIWKELYYWHCVAACQENGKIIMTCKVVGYAGNSHHSHDDISEEEE